MQEDRERMVVRRFKFEEPRIEQIQDLEVCIVMFIEYIRVSLVIPKLWKILEICL